MNFAHNVEQEKDGKKIIANGVVMENNKLIGILILLLLLICPKVFGATLYKQDCDSGVQVQFTWEPNPAEEDVIGYRIYFGDEPRVYDKYIHVGNVVTANVKCLPAGKYYFAAVAYRGGIESGYSNEIEVLVPSIPKIKVRIVIDVDGNGI